MLAAAGSDEEKRAIIQKASSIAAERLVAETEAAHARMRETGAPVDGATMGLDFSLVEAVQVEGWPHGIDYDAADEFGTRDDDPADGMSLDEFEQLNRQMFGLEPETAA